MLHLLFSYMRTFVILRIIKWKRVAGLTLAPLATLVYFWHPDESFLFLQKILSKTLSKFCKKLVICSMTILFPKLDMFFCKNGCQKSPPKTSIISRTFFGGGGGPTLFLKIGGRKPRVFFWNLGGEGGGGSGDPSPPMWGYKFDHAQALLWFIPNSS